VHFLPSGRIVTFCDGSASVVRDQTHVLNRGGREVYSSIDRL